MRTSLQVLLLGVSGAFAQLQYGNNERVTTKDNPAVAKAFPEVEGIELLSPAFSRPELTPPGWENGTEGPTSLTEMGTIDLDLNDLASQTTSTEPSRNVAAG
jgi:hypothetical protein